MAELKTKPDDEDELVGLAVVPLPTGTVTFLFTDIEGSTRMWDQHPEAMRDALARHDELVRRAIEQHRGHVFKTIGDAFCAAFAATEDGLAAALAVQRSLLAEPSDASTRIRVRIALHTGTAEERDGDYFGPVLNRCARLLAVAHGGQTILSRMTKDRLPEELPRDIALKDLALHRLRDLTEPEHVFQLLHPALPSDFPPLGSLNSLPNNLPLRPSRFIGRLDETEAVHGFLDQTSLLTLTGAGGSGKTRLALQVAADRIDRYRDGVWLVELDPLEDGALMPQAIAAALGVRETPALTMQDALIEHLRRKQALLVLDNCEHVIDAAAGIAQALLRVCPDVKIMATSRQALGIEGELLYVVPPLTTPHAAAGALDPEERLRDILRSESAQLFVERATETAPGFHLTPANAPAVAEICRRLDGVALAIELAAARVRVLSPEQIAARLNDHLRLLTAGRRGALPRQQTMRAAVEWSFNLLTEPERALMRRLAVFSGGWTLEMAEALCAGGEIETWDVLDLLSSLVDKSLVVADAEGAARRYRMLETIRQFALEQLVACGEEAGLRQNHLAWCVSFAEEAQAALRGPAQAEQLNRLEVEHDNLRTALAWSAAHGTHDQGLRLAASLWMYWYLRGYLSEGRTYLAQLLSRADEAGVEPDVRATALHAVGGLAYYQGDYQAARLAWEEGLAIWRTHGDSAHVSQLLNNLGLVLRSLSDYAAARECYEQSLDMFRQRGDQSDVAATLNNLALLAYDQGNLAEAHELLEECLPIKRALGDPHEIAQSLCALAGVMWLEGDYAGARAAGEEGLRYYREAGTDYGTAEALEVLAKIACELGDHALALALGEECLALRRALGDAQGVADALTCLALVYLRTGADDLAEPALHEGLALARRVSFRRGIATALQYSGLLSERRSDHARAAMCYRESLEIGRDLHSVWNIAGTIECLIGLAVARGEAEHALRLAGAADAVRACSEMPRPPAVNIELALQVAAARGRLDPSTADTAWFEGRGLSLEAAIDDALGVAYLRAP